MVHVVSVIFFFFFQAEDGIRDLTVTGVQTCALPICRPLGHRLSARAFAPRLCGQPEKAEARAHRALPATRGDRKSTRLNSSHSQISYAVFCLKKKKKKKTNDMYD